MGVSYYVYIGPYIQAPNPEKEGVEEFQGCPKHKKPSSDKFCNQCGAAIKLISVPSMKRINFDTYEEFKDSLCELYDEYCPNNMKDIAIFKPNKGKFGQEFSAYHYSIVPMNETIMTNEVARMKSTFAKEIERIVEVFGKAEVKWGVIAYSS
jgi:hypothetical protein